MSAAHVIGASRPRLLDFRSGGWLLLAAGVLCALIVAGWVLRLSQRRPVVGDGRSIASYAFDLSTCLVPRERIVAAGFPRDGVPALSSPAVFTPAQAAEHGQRLRRTHQGKFLVDTDLVVGVAVGDQARAYPLSLLTWHEVVNDTVGGRPICVTYNPLCDSTVVFDRRVAGEMLEFGVSGLLYNSNLLMYDRRPDARGESLWSQLQFRAVTGPAAARGLELERVPAVLVPWSQWLTRYPQTSVLAPDPLRQRLYNRTYEPYFGSDLLRFPVAPLPPAGGLALKTPIVAVPVAGGWDVRPRAELADPWNPGGSQETAAPVYSFWFAWYAMHPDP